MCFKFEARESVGYRATWTIMAGTAPVDITGWVFKSTFERQAGTPDFTLNMADALDPALEGFFVADGPTGQLSINILPATLQGIDDTTGDFVLEADLLGTPPGAPREFIDAIEATIIEGPTV